jgi:hypothetical protein
MWLVAVLETYVLMDKRRAHGWLGLLMDQNISSGPKFCISYMQNCATVENRLACLNACRPFKL